MSRICPKCKTEIKSPTLLFCFVCGEKLPSPKIKKEKKGLESLRVEEKITLKEEKPQEEKGIRPSLLKMGGAVFAILILGTATFLGYKYLPKKTKEKIFPQEVLNQVILSDVSYPFPVAPFYQDQLAEIVPSKIDFYLESTRPEIFLREILSLEQENLFGEKVGLNLSEATSFLGTPFGVLGKEGSFAFVAQVKALDFVTRKVAEVGEVLVGEDTWKAEVSQGFLIVSNSSSLLEEIKEAQGKIVLNLALDSEFATLKRKLPLTGQALLYGEIKEFSWLLPVLKLPELRGKGFVMTKKDSGTLIQGVEK